MANNNAIQILRTGKNGITNTNKVVELLDGQPFYNKQKNYLTIGKSTFSGDDETKSKVNALPITVPTVEGWFDDIPDTGDEDIIESSSIGNGQNNPYSIKPSKRFSPVRNTQDITTANYLDVEAENIYLNGSTRVKNHIDFGEVYSKTPIVTQYSKNSKKYWKINNDETEVEATTGTPPEITVDANGNWKIGESTTSIKAEGRYVDYGARIVYTPAEESNTPGGTAGTLNITANEMYFNKKQDGTWERIDSHPGKLSLNAGAGMSLNGKTVITGTQNPGSGTVSPETENIPLVVTTGQKGNDESGYTIESLIVGPRNLYSYEGSKETSNGNFEYAPCSLAINQKAQAGVIIGNGIIQVGSDINGDWIDNCVGIGCSPEAGLKLKVDGDTTITGETSITDATPSTGTSSGALKVSGGVGVAENLYVGGNITVTQGNDSTTVTSDQVKAIKFTSDNSFHMRVEKSNELNFDIAGGNKIFFNYRKLSSVSSAASTIRFCNGQAFTSNTTNAGLGSIECDQVTCNDKVTLQYDTSSNALKFVFI